MTYDNLCLCTIFNGACEYDVVRLLGTYTQNIQGISVTIIPLLSFNSASNKSKDRLKIAYKGQMVYNII